jgi:hypothetical protein
VSYPLSHSGCQECGGAGADIRHSGFRRVVGVVFFDRVHTYEGNFCRDCRRRLFFKYQGLTLLFGWWGTFAMLFRNPHAIVANFMALRGGEIADVE